MRASSDRSGTLSFQLLIRFSGRRHSLGIIRIATLELRKEPCGELCRGMSGPRRRDDVIASRLTDVPDHTVCGCDLEKVALRPADRDRRILGELEENL